MAAGETTTVPGRGGASAVRAGGLMAPSALDVDELTLEPIDQWLDGIKAGFADKFLWIFSGMGIEDTEDLRLMKKGRVATMREDLPFQEQEVDSEEDQRPRAVVCLMRSEAWGEHVHVRGGAAGGAGCPWDAFAGS